MSGITAPPRKPGVVGPQTRRWTLEEYHRLGELGFFQDQRVELIGGEIVAMSPIGNPHVVAVSLTWQALQAAFGSGYWFRIQAPLQIVGCEPEPDIAVVYGSPRDYTRHPTTALLVVEVSDTSLDYDRTAKASLYAAAGIADYWIVNLEDGRLEVYRNPQADTGQPFGFRYGDVTNHGPTDAVAPLAAAGASVRVADLLP